MECAAFEHGSHKKVIIADLTAELREAILHQVDCTSTVTKQLGEAKLQLQACCGQVEVTADASKQAVDAFAKQVRQALSASVDAVNVKVDCSTSRKLGVSVFIGEMSCRLYASMTSRCTLSDAHTDAKDCPGLVRAAPHLSQFCFCC
jgi:hypothetical protein